VFVSAARRSEIGNTESTTFLAWVRKSRPRLFLPTLLMAEVAGASTHSAADRLTSARHPMHCRHQVHSVAVRRHRWERLRPLPCHASSPRRKRVAPSPRR
jgi:hypothetical protein